MKRASDRAIEIINDLHTERLDYTSEYLPLIEAANTLSAYEDTRLEPEEITALCDMDRRAKIAEMLRIEEQSGVSIDRLRELVEADKDGRCVVLPVKKGDKVYYLQSYFNDTKMRSERKVKCGIVDFVQSVPDLFVCNGVTYRFFDFCEIGKTVFLTREAAEEALKGGQNG